MGQGGGATSPTPGSPGTSATKVEDEAVARQAFQSNGPGHPVLSLAEILGWLRREQREQVRMARLHT